LTVQDDSATSGSATIATVRGAENATNATTYTDPFPTVAAVSNANANWVKSNAANTTARAFDIFVGTTWVIYIVNFTGATNVWELHMFGDASPALAGDTYATFCTTRGTSAVVTALGYALGTTTNTYQNKMFWARTYDATVKSPQCAVQTLTIASFSIGNLGTIPSAQSGPSTGIDRMKIVLGDAGTAATTPSTSLGLVVRGWMPNLWLPLHGGRGAVNTRDIFTDTAYNASAQFMVTAGANVATSPFALIETTDTWTAP
jgi:hypothetical protein